MRKVALQQILIRSYFQMKAIFFTLAIMLSILSEAQNIRKKGDGTYIMSLTDYETIEASKNAKFRKNKGTGFFYKYELPDAFSEAFAIFRTYESESNSGAIVLKNARNVIQLLGQYKFSSSDIDRTNDTLSIAVYYISDKEDVKKTYLNEDTFPSYSIKKEITYASNHFIPLALDISKLHSDDGESKFLVIQFTIKSGSDDSFYHGNSNAVFDDLKLVFE